MQSSEDKRIFYIHELKNIAISLHDSAEFLDEEEVLADGEKSTLALYKKKIKELQNTFNNYIDYIDKEKL